MEPTQRERLVTVMVDVTEPLLTPEIKDLADKMGVDLTLQQVKRVTARLASLGVLNRHSIRTEHRKRGEHFVAYTLSDYTRRQLEKGPAPIARLAPKKPKPTPPANFGALWGFNPRPLT